MTRPYRPPSSLPAPQGGAFALPDDPDRALQVMIDLSERLKSVLAEETQALQKSDTRAFFRLQDAKLRTAQDYQAAIGQLMARREEMKKANPALRDRLEKARAAFSEGALANRSELERARRSVARLGERMMTLARRAAQGKTSVSYDATGSMEPDARRRVSMGIAESA